MQKVRGGGGASKRRRDPKRGLRNVFADSPAIGQFQTCRRYILEISAVRTEFDGDRSGGDLLGPHSSYVKGMTEKGFVVIITPSLKPRLANEPPLGYLYGSRSRGGPGLRIKRSRKKRRHWRWDEPPSAIVVCTCLNNPIFCLLKPIPQTMVA